MLTPPRIRDFADDLGKATTECWPSNAEYLENEVLPATDITEDWLKLIDYDPDNVVKISPVRILDRSKAKPASGVI